MIYAYTINYKTGAVKEYRGYIARIFSNKLQFHAVDETGGIYRPLLDRASTK